MSPISEISLAADIIGIAGAIFALAAWWQARKIRQAMDFEKTRQKKRFGLCFLMVIRKSICQFLY